MNTLFFITLIAAAVSGNGLPADASFEVGSMGGKVRSGPGVHFEQIGSLQNGDPVQLLEKTMERAKGFNWYRISYRGGKIGYQWGGVLCSYGNQIDDIHIFCQRDNRSIRIQPIPIH